MRRATPGSEVETRGLLVRCEKGDAPLRRNPLKWMAPRPGLEPGTCGAMTRRLLLAAARAGETGETETEKCERAGFRHRPSIEP